MPGDATARFSSIEAGEYSDVRYLAYWDVAPSGSALNIAPMLGAKPTEAELRVRDEVTTAQVRTVMDNLAKRKVRSPGQPRRPALPQPF
jgi:hypothetical protein